MIMRMQDVITVHRPYRGRLFAVEVVRRGMASREVVRHPGAVLKVPCLDGDRLALVRNCRVAVNKRLWELPAGTLKPGERPQIAAGRDLEEETGYRAAVITHLGDFYTSSGFCDELGSAPPTDWSSSASGWNPTRTSRWAW